MPDALHLLRLARSSPERPVELPGGSLRVLHLTARQDGGAAACWYVCLEGTLILDLPHGDFVQVRAGESYQAPAGEARTLMPVGAVTVLLISA
ncbi:cupin domain-containing protein [Deinococcus sp. KNUC1210]|uniref:cupin domain-containing protein n=1 Tax=Deinococcus sp. KNUC1210 TaxID=2917691 RepID=UPI001EF0353A|nr:cupin domain-containing protein [Deinococcus sp. KNUC1210]ULH16723.1 cupin domain-containing protein [Deinococcus sp. KNUC1210]